MAPVIIIGGGLAGSEAALQLAGRGFKVKLFEMRPLVPTPAHATGELAELVCSNSLKSMYAEKAQGLLKIELEQLGSILIHNAYQTRVPAGKALAVDRDKFATVITTLVEQHPNIELIRREVAEIPSESIVVIATGPLTSVALTEAIQKLLGEEDLYFFDAISPILDIAGIDWDRAFWGSRYEAGSDYVNCEMNREEFESFAQALVLAERAPVKNFEKGMLFEGCMPIEQMAERVFDAMRYGPMKPVGLENPKTGKRPYAVVQLRKEKEQGSFCNIVGFQTRLTYAEQKRVFGMIPALRNVDFERFGSMHRNTYINGPKHLAPTFEARARKGLFFAGQITGVEGYVESIASGLMAAINIASRLDDGGEGQQIIFPETTMLGALQRYVGTPDETRRKFQPSAANFGLLPSLGRGKKDRKLYAERSLADLKDFMTRNGIEPLKIMQ